MIKESIPQIESLSDADKITLLDELWQDVAAHAGQIPVHDWQKSELDRRYEEYLKNPTKGSSWPEVRDRLRRAL